MRVKFCGAAQEVTGSSHLLTLDNGYRILLDCGLYQGPEPDDPDHPLAGFNEKWLFNPAKIDCLILSHSHIDHCGRIPRLVKDGFEGLIYCTHSARDLCALMLTDSAKIQEPTLPITTNTSLPKKSGSRTTPLQTPTGPCSNSSA